MTNGNLFYFLVVISQIINIIGEGQGTASVVAVSISSVSTSCEAYFQSKTRFFAQFVISSSNLPSFISLSLASLAVDKFLLFKLDRPGTVLVYYILFTSTADVSYQSQDSSQVRKLS